MIPSEDNIKKTSVFVVLMLCVYVYAYVAAVLRFAYAQVKTSLNRGLTVYVHKKVRTHYFWLPSFGSRFFFSRCLSPFLGSETEGME